MKLAVLSGKGGAGKTFAAVNLAATAGACTYIDCDAEEPNGRLFLKPQDILDREVTVPLPAFDGAKCDGCRACVSFCRFHALAFLKGVPRVFPEVCHGCGGCALFCPRGAVGETRRRVGQVELGRRVAMQVVTGVLDPGEASAVPVIRAALEVGTAQDGPVVIDCPPGSGCAVSESAAAADICLLVAEPTAFGLDNFCMVRELTALLEKPCAVLINKAGPEPYEPLEAACRKFDLPVVARVPFQKELAALGAQGRLAVEADPAVKALFAVVWTQLGGMVP